MTTFEPPGGVGAGVGALLTMTADKASESVHEAADKADVATKSDATRRRAVKVKPAAPSATATACALAATKVTEAAAITADADAPLESNFVCAAAVDEADATVAAAHETANTAAKQEKAAADKAKSDEVPAAALAHDRTAEAPPPPALAACAPHTAAHATAEDPGVALGRRAAPHARRARRARRARERASARLSLDITRSRMPEREHFTRSPAHAHSRRAAAAADGGARNGRDAAVNDLRGTGGVLFSLLSARTSPPRDLRGRVHISAERGRRRAAEISV